MANATIFCPGGLPNVSANGPCTMNLLEWNTGTPTCDYVIHIAGFSFLSSENVVSDLPLTDVLILGPVPQEMSSESSLSPLLQQQKNKSEIANEELHKIISSVQINPTPERVLHPVPSNYSDYDNSHTTSNLTAALQAGLGWQYLPHRGGEDRVITLQAMPLSLPNLSDSSGLTR